MTPTPLGIVHEAILQQMAAEIREEIPEAEVRLFGSRARGDARTGSDVDLMISVTDEWYARHNWLQTLGSLWRKLAHHRVPIDLLLYHRRKVEERRHWLSHVIALAQREGSVALRDLQTAQPPRIWALNYWPGWPLKAILKSASVCPCGRGRSAPMAPSFTPKKV